MEEPGDGRSLPDVDQDSRCAEIVSQSEPRAAASDVGRRNSLASLTDIRRRDSAQFKGLVIPSPAVASGDVAKSSVCSLPTISGAKPQSKLLLTSSTTQQRRGSVGYQSVLTGLSFISTSRSNPATTASNAHRRSSVYGYPSMQSSSASSFSSLLGEPSGMFQRANNVSADREGDVNANELDLSHHLDEFRNPMSRQPPASVDSIGDSDEIPMLPSSLPPHSRVEEPADDKLLLWDGVDNDISSSSARFPASSTDREHDVSHYTSTTESPKVNNLKVDKQHEERPQNVTDNTDVEQGMRAFQSDGIDDNRGVLSTSTSDALTGNELTVPECEPESRDRSLASKSQAEIVNSSSVRCPADCTETAANSGRGRAAGTAVDVDHGDWESSSSTSHGSQRSQVDGKYNGDADDTGTRSDEAPAPDNDSLTTVIINKGNLGLGFCISGGRISATGYSPIVVKRIFTGMFIVSSIHSDRIPAPQLNIPSPVLHLLFHSMIYV